MQKLVHRLALGTRLIEWFVVGCYSALQLMDSSDAAGECLGLGQRIRNPLSMMDDQGAVHAKLLTEY